MNTIYLTKKLSALNFVGDDFNHPGEGSQPFVLTVCNHLMSTNSVAKELKVARECDQVMERSGTASLSNMRSLWDRAETTKNTDIAMTTQTAAHKTNAPVNTVTIMAINTILLTRENNLIHTYTVELHQNKKNNSNLQL